jgi:hypothetical protein
MLVLIFGADLFIYSGSNGHSNGHGGGYGGGGYGGGGGDRMSNLGAGLQKQNWGLYHSMPRPVANHSNSQI